MHESFRLLNQYAPTLFECASRSKSDSEIIQRKYDQRLSSMAQALETNGIFSVKTCIFELLWDASENKNNCVEYLSFIDCTVRRALDATDGAVRTQLEKLVIKIIISFGSDNSDYLNHFAEIAVIETLMTKGGYKLECIEKILPNGKRVDFEISKDGIRYLMEVYNINFDIGKLNTSGDLKEFLEKGRLGPKLNAKLNGIDNLGASFLLIPVLRGDIMSLVKYLEVFEYFKQSPIIAPFMMIAQYTNQISGQVEYDFNSVENFLLRVKKRKEGKL